MKKEMIDNKVAHEAEKKMEWAGDSRGEGSEPLRLGEVRSLPHSTLRGRLGSQVLFSMVQDLKMNKEW